MTASRSVPIERQNQSLVPPNNIDSPLHLCWDLPTTAACVGFLMDHVTHQQDPDHGGLAFVHISHPHEIKQKANQKAIRRHVMGRVGRSRRKAPLTFSLSVNLLPDENNALDRENSGRACWGSIPPSLPLSGLYPVTVNPRVLQLIQFMHAEGDYLYRPFRIQWFSMAIVDSSAFYLSLANAALFVNRLDQQGYLEYSDSVESAKYYSECLNQITQRLASRTESLSQGVITTVLGFLCHDSTIGKWQRWAVHMSGLKRILELRGDLQRLPLDVSLFVLWCVGKLLINIIISDGRYLIFFRMDVVGSVVSDSPPRFSIPDQLTDLLVPQGQISPLLSDLLVQLKSTPGDLALTAIVLEKAAYLSIHVNKNAVDPAFWKDGRQASMLVGPITHFLLSLPRLPHPNLGSNISPAALLREMTRLALLAMLARLKKVFSLVSDEFEALHEKISLLLPFAATVYGLFPELCLWAIITVSSLSQGSTPHWHLAQIYEVMVTSKMLSGKTAIAVAKSIVWVNGLMDVHVDRLSAEIDDYSNLQRSDYRTW